MANNLQVQKVTYIVILDWNKGEQPLPTVCMLIISLKPNNPPPLIRVQ